MVTYAYAAQFPTEVEKLAVMDAFLPSVAGWELAYDAPDFATFGSMVGHRKVSLKGREKGYFAYFWNDLAADRKSSLATADRNAYVGAYSRSHGAGWAYFAAWPETVRDFAQMAQTKLPMPVLSISGEKASAAIQGNRLQLLPFGL